MLLDTWTLAYDCVCIFMIQFQAHLEYVDNGIELRTRPHSTKLKTHCRKTVDMQLDYTLIRLNSSWIL